MCEKIPALLTGDIRNTQKANFWIFYAIFVDKYSQISYTINHIDESQFGDKEEMLLEMIAKYLGVQINQKQKENPDHTIEDIRYA